MKKISVIILLGWMLFSCTAKPGFEIVGNIAGADGESITLLKNAGKSFVTIDSTVIENGQFRFKGHIDFPDMYYLSLSQRNDKKQFFLENSLLSISGSADSLDFLQIEGSNSQKEYEQYEGLMKPFDDQMQKVFSEYHDARLADDQDKMNDLSEQYDIIQDGIKSISFQFVLDHAESFISPHIINRLAYDLSLEELAELLDALDEKLLINPTVGNLENRLAALRNTEIGQSAPDFELPDTENNLIKLSDKIGSKLLLIDFWACWCSPCRQENPNVVAVYQKYHDKGFDVFGVSLDDDKDSWLEAISSDQLTWTHVSQLQGWVSEAAKKYAVSAIPANFLLDDKGIIIAKNLRGEDLGNKIKEILGE
ncbi:MAG TPA: TlpA disulfide reductase family protein [Candidatus Cloacimonadota bacterium]|nr:TlpA disulfide reductase family protein [Candidatus Cloacimonadota bacterium]